MRALIWKETRELVPAFTLLLSSAVVVGIVDVSYNWNKALFVGVSLGFCWLIAIVAALLGGANTVARESRSNLSFLSSWPIGLRQIWLAKFLVTVLMLTLLIALSFGICGGLLAYRGYDVYETFGDIVPFPLEINAALVVGLFAFGVMLSGVVRWPTAAAGLAVVVAGGCMLAYSYATCDYLPARWGPWLGVFWPDVPPATHIKVTVALSGLAVIASAWGFIRAPVLESGQRLRQTGAGFLGLVGVVAVVSLVGAIIWARPSLSEVEGVTVDPTGHWMTLDSGPPHDNAVGVGGIWIMDVEGKHKQLLARGPISSLSWSPNGERIFFRWGEDAPGEGWDWQAEAPEWKLQPIVLESTDRRRVEWGMMEPYLSPRGTYFFYIRENLLVLTDGERDVLEIDTEVRSLSLDAIIGGDPTRSYYTCGQPTYRVASEAAHLLAETTLLIELKIPGRERRLVATLEGEVPWGEVSPDGQWIATGRYLWCRTLAEQWEDRELKILDTEKLAVVNSVGRAELAGQVPMVPHFSPGGDSVFFMASQPEELSYERSQHLWSARPDGSDVKYVRKLPHGTGWAGATYEGDLLLWNHEAATVIRLDPDTGEQWVIKLIGPAESGRVSRLSIRHIRH